MRPGILFCLSLDFLGIGLFEESRQFRAELWKMIKQLRICKIVRSGNVRVLIDRGDPGLENLLPMGEYKVAKTGDCAGRRLLLNGTSDERNPPTFVSGVNGYAALGQRIIPKKISNQQRALDSECTSVRSSKTADLIRPDAYGVRKILPV